MRGLNSTLVMPSLSSIFPVRTRATRLALVALVFAGLALGGAITATDPGTPEVHDNPRIIDFRVYTDGFDQYVFTGQVVDCDNVGGLTVTFDGGVTATSTTNSNGYFSLERTIPDGKNLTVCATATCRHAMTSDPVYVILP